MTKNMTIVGAVVVVILVLGFVAISQNKTAVEDSMYDENDTAMMVDGTDMMQDETMPHVDDEDVTMHGGGDMMMASSAPEATTGQTTTTVSDGTVKEFTVTGSNFKFDPAVITVAKGDTVKITFKNSNGMHDFRVDGYEVGSKVIQTGEEEIVEFVADKAGRFEYYCSVGQHRQMGMKGTLVVQ